jgi:hypothetical protein
MLSPGIADSPCATWDAEELASLRAASNLPGAAYTGPYTLKFSPQNPTPGGRERCLFFAWRL